MFEFGVCNGVYVIGLEYKMGLKFFLICELMFGGVDVFVVGYLVGGVYNGIVQMFMVIEYVCMIIGVKFVGILLMGYFNVFVFVKEWVQGVDLIQMMDKMVLWVIIMYYFDVWCSLMI